MVDRGIAPPTPINDIADSSTADVANIATLGHFRFLFPEFPVERRFIVALLALMVNMAFVNNVRKLHYCANNLKYYIRYRIRLLGDPLFVSDVEIP